MPEICTGLTTEFCLEIKGEAVDRGMCLKQLIAMIPEEHIKVNRNDRPLKPLKDNQKRPECYFPLPVRPGRSK
jgi:hypothetical protein